MSETRAFIGKLMLYETRANACFKFRGRIAWQSFFENNFADFSDVVRVKKNQDFVQPLVAFPISNISYFKIFHKLNKWKFLIPVN